MNKAPINMPGKQDLVLDVMNLQGEVVRQDYIGEAKADQLWRAVEMVGYGNLSYNGMDITYNRSRNSLSGGGVEDLLGILELQRPTNAPRPVLAHPAAKPVPAPSFAPRPLSFG